MMKNYLLDTNACVAIRNDFRGATSKDPERKARQERLIAKWRAMPADALAMSFVTLGELSLWAEKHSDPKSAKALLSDLVKVVRIVGATAGHASREAESLAEAYGQVRAALERAGNCIGANDLWIASHALALGLTVVTNNTSEFQRVPGLAVEDWTA